MASNTEDQSALIKMLLARAGDASSAGLPFSGLPFSGLPQLPKAAMFSTDFSQTAQPRASVPDVTPPPAPMMQPMERIKTGQGFGEGLLEKAAAESGKKSPAEDDGMKKIRDAMAASKNALAALYGQPSASSVASSAGPTPKRAYNPMQAPDTGETMPSEMALEQYRYNLGNIRASDIGWQGKTTPFKGFESFSSPEQGARAMFKNLNSYAKSAPDMTMADAIAKWAPPSENNTNNYVKFVAENANLPGNLPLREILSDPQKAAAMMYWMGRMEHGRNLPKIFTPEFLAKVVAGV